MGQDDAGLAAAIEVVRRELLAAQQQGQDSGLQFVVGPVELEFVVDVTQEAGAGASVKVLSLFSLGGKGSVSREVTNRIRVTLGAVGPDGKPFEVASYRQGRPGG